MQLWHSLKFAKTTTSREHSLRKSSSTFGNGYQNVDKKGYCVSDIEISAKSRLQFGIIYGCNIKRAIDESLHSADDTWKEPISQGEHFVTRLMNPKTVYSFKFVFLCHALSLNFKWHETWLRSSASERIAQKKVNMKGYCTNEAPKYRLTWTCIALAFTQIQTYAFAPQAAYVNVLVVNIIQYWLALHIWWSTNKSSLQIIICSSVLLGKMMGEKKTEEQRPRWRWRWRFLWRRFKGMKIHLNWPYLSENDTLNVAHERKNHRDRKRRFKNFILVLENVRKKKVSLTQTEKPV